MCHFRLLLYVIFLMQRFKANITGIATQGKISGLTPKTTYTCTIYAVSGSNGPMSDPITVTTTYERKSRHTCLSHFNLYYFAAPNPPVLQNVSTIDSQSVHVTWRVPTQLNRVLISYTITYHTDDDNSRRIYISYNGRTVSTMGSHVLVLVFAI